MKIKRILILLLVQKKSILYFKNFYQVFFFRKISTISKAIVSNNFEDENLDAFVEVSTFIVNLKFEYFFRNVVLAEKRLKNSMVIVI